MREFFPLILHHLHSSQLFCGLENHGLLSYQSTCIQDDTWGGPALQFLSPFMFDALVNDISKVVVSVQDVYDAELQSSFLALVNAGTLEEALTLERR